ncbi:GAD-like domain-containing protein [Mycobacterium sp. ST-F2]|uniref:DUF7161 family protein n=1 Tax=Mycobacterium sp. ST-F2 TaxID=1490484 RepID=UPI001438ED20|nr:GAD-like domain-containing protein [Mycobacterium sp. ST-F2]
MSRETDEFVRKWGVPTVSSRAPDERLEQYRDVVPELLLTFWREFGFAGFGNGLFWLCDPVAWQPAVDTWTAGLNLAMGDDSWLAVSRSAFGRMQLWGQRTGMSLTITPYSGWVRPNDRSHRMSTSVRRNGQIYAALFAPDTTSLDVIGDDDQPLFGRVLARQGPVGPDTMYGFVPALAVGGSLLPDRVEIFDADVHMQLLSELTPRQILTDVTQAPRWRPVRLDQTGLSGVTARLLTNDPTDDAGWPADLPSGTTEVVIVDDTPGPLLTVRVHPVGSPSAGVYVRFDQLAVRD